MIKAESKILSGKRLSEKLAGLKLQKKRIVFTNGCFDIIHVGHVDYLAKAKRLGDVLIVGLNSDRSVKAIKGKSRPINNEYDRAKILAELISVDFIIIFKDNTPEKIIKKLKPDILVKGGDWSKSEIAGGTFVKQSGGRVLTIPFVPGYSTTSLLKKIETLK